MGVITHNLSHVFKKAARLVTCAAVIITGLSVSSCKSYHEARAQSKLDDEANALAKRYWDRILTQCGNSYYYYVAKETLSPFPHYIEGNPRVHAGKELVLFELKGVKLSEPVSLVKSDSADSLNGWEYLTSETGASSWKAATVRGRIYSVENKTWGAWSRWSDDIDGNILGRTIHSVGIAKKKGDPLTTKGTAIDPQWELPPCEIITAEPPGLPVPYVRQGKKVNP
jgi:hypothetical protein